MSLKTQSKVLRTLDEQRFTPVGSDEEVAVDVRVVAATNKDLEEEIGKGNFREDLFYQARMSSRFSCPHCGTAKKISPCFPGISCVNSPRNTAGAPSISPKKRWKC